LAIFNNLDGDDNEDYNYDDGALCYKCVWQKQADFLMVLFCSSSVCANVITLSSNIFITAQNVTAFRFISCYDNSPTRSSSQVSK